MDFSKPPWWILLPGAIGFNVMGIFAPSLFPQWVQTLCFFIGFALVCWCIAGTGWHNRRAWLPAMRRPPLPSFWRAKHTALASAPASSPAKASTGDQGRLDSALYAMFELLSDAQAHAYEEARSVTGEVENTVHPSATHGVSLGLERLTRADQALVIAIQRLTDIQFREFAYYRDELRNVFDNGPISAARQAIADMRTVLKAIPEKPDAALIRAVESKFRDFDEALAVFGQWIADRMQAIKAMRSSSST